MISDAVSRASKGLNLAGGTGLSNTGNLCFLNSSLHFWFSDKGFLQQVLRPDPENHKFVTADLWDESTQAAIKTDESIRAARKKVLTSLQGIFQEWEKQSPNKSIIEQQKLVFQKNLDVTMLAEPNLDKKWLESTEDHTKRMLAKLNADGLDPYFNPGHQGQKSEGDLNLWITTMIFGISKKWN